MVETVGELLRDAGLDPRLLDVGLDSFPVPAGLDYALGISEPQPPSPTKPLRALPDGRMVVLAGPEVVRNRCMDGLRAFAAAANAPVANTWGAKGVFEWDSPHHMGTCGLQARDFELLGFADFDVIVATGIDELESPAERYALAPHLIDVDPFALAEVATRVTRMAEAIPGNELYTRLATIAQPGFVDDRIPLHPARAVADIGAALPSDGIVFADPGTSGLWVARTFPTADPGTVVVPATAMPGIATILAVVTALRGHNAIAVTTEPLDDTTRAVLDIAADQAATFVLDVWGEGDASGTALEHGDALQHATNEPGVTIVDAPVDLALTDELLNAAGPLVAWQRERRTEG